MQKNVCIRIERKNYSEVLKQKAHDFREKVPGYIIEPKKPMCDKENISKEKFLDIIENQKVLYEKAIGKKLAKNSKNFIVGIITFSPDEQTLIANQETDTWKRMYKTAKEVVQEICADLNSQEVYTTGHIDEKSLHFHFCIENFDYKNNKTLRDKLTKKYFKKLQDIAAKHFSKYGFVRGIEGSKQKHQSVALSHRIEAYKNLKLQKLNQKLQKDITDIATLEEKHYKELLNIYNNIINAYTSCSKKKNLNPLRAFCEDFKNELKRKGIKIEENEAILKEIKELETQTKKKPRFGL